jgi:hypothetical protein
LVGRRVEPLAFGGEREFDRADEGHPPREGPVGPVLVAKHAPDRFGARVDVDGQSDVPLNFRHESSLACAPARRVRVGTLMFFAIS